MSTEELIKELTKECSAVKPVRPTLRSTGWVVFALVSGILVSFAVGIRHDIKIMAESDMFILELSLAFAAGLIAALAANWLSIPGAKNQQRWLVWLPFLPITMLVFVVGYQIFESPLHLSQAGKSFHCATDILMVALVPAIAIFIMLRCAACTRRKITSVMAILAVAAFAYLCSRLICPNDDMGHVIMWHYLPSIVISVIGAIIGTKILKW